jgi:O-antigen/teichoic acid export membrane protein
MERAHLADYWAFLKWIALGYITSAFMLQINVPILQFFQSSEEVARYFSAFKIAQVFWIMENVVGFVLLPKLSQLMGEQGIAAIRRVVGRLWMSVAILSAALVVFLVLFAQLLLGVVFGASYASSSYILYLLIPAGVSFFFFNTGGIVLLSLGRSDINAKLGLLGVAINLIASMTLIPLLGAAGAAIAAQITFLVPAMAIWLIIWRSLHR